MSGWQWDETLYRGSAEHYVRGRVPYPSQLVETIRDELGLDGRGRLLDVGCGPGKLTVPLAASFEEAVGIDADPEMVAAAKRIAPANARFVQLRAEELPAGLSVFRLATFAQSFHWMEQERVARAVRGMLETGGAAVHVGATTHEGDGNVPREQIAELIRSYLGPHRRAGRGVVPERTARSEDAAYAAAGFRGPRRVDVAWGEVVERTEDDVVASVFSMSTAAPHLFGDRLQEFERDLRALLGGGPFYERMRDIGFSVWAR